MPLVISTRALGKRKPLLADFSVSPPENFGDGDDFTLRDLIGHVVRQEVAEYRQRRKRNRFDRVLTERQIEEGAIRGKVDPGGKTHVQPVDEETAVASALLAFEDGLYLVIVDEIERKSLDEPLRLSPDSRITFIRLTFLAGA